LLSCCLLVELLLSVLLIFLLLQLVLWCCCFVFGCFVRVLFCKNLLPSWLTITPLVLPLRDLLQEGIHLQTPTSSPKEENILLEALLHKATPAVPLIPMILTLIHMEALLHKVIHRLVIQEVLLLKAIQAVLLPRVIQAVLPPKAFLLGVIRHLVIIQEALLLMDMQEALLLSTTPPLVLAIILHRDTRLILTNTLPLVDHPLKVIHQTDSILPLMEVLLMANTPLMLFSLAQLCSLAIQI